MNAGSKGRLCSVRVSVGSKGRLCSVRVNVGSKGRLCSVRVDVGSKGRLCSVRVKVGSKGRLCRVRVDVLTIIQLLTDVTVALPHFAIPLLGQIKTKLHFAHPVTSHTDIAKAFFTLKFFYDFRVNLKCYFVMPIRKVQPTLCQFSRNSKIQHTEFHTNRKINMYSTDRTPSAPLNTV